MVGESCALYIDWTVLVVVVTDTRKEKVCLQNYYSDIHTSITMFVVFLFTIISLSASSLIVRSDTYMFYLLLIMLQLPFSSPAPSECPLTNVNLLTAKLFVENAEKCRQFCQSDLLCKYYTFYPARHEHPSQCYFYETCGRLVRPSYIDHSQGYNYSLSQGLPSCT